ncbi:MAG: hypothetical protein HY901_05860 [Deltaproteobacteria bacterium]|nr:hypothetical protein [Deltaproteobacteria bacterium]
MKSSAPSTELDLDKGICTSPKDVEALRRLSSKPSMSWESYLELLQSLPVSLERLRERRGPRGEPFAL